MTRPQAFLLHVIPIALIYCLCPVSTSGDSRWTMPVAANLIDHGSTTLDPYAALAHALPNGTWERARNGHLYATIPVAVPVIAVPFVLALRFAFRVARQILPIRTTAPVMQQLLAGKFDGLAYSGAEMLVASCLMALAAGIQFLIAFEFLPLRPASFLTILYAFATPLWSTATRALWNQTPAQLMLILAIYLLVLARRNPRYAAYASIPLEIAFMARPGMILHAAVLTLFVAMYYRREFLRFCGLALPLAALFFTYNLTQRGALFQTYFTNPGFWEPASLPVRLGLQLISPSRGLFVFCPLVFFSFAGIWIALRTGWLPLAKFLAAMILLQIALVTKYYWPGYCYGPRFYTEITPLFTFFLIPILQRLRATNIAWRIVFATACAWSFLVQARGATAFAVHQWNETPVSVDEAKYRVWDWNDPQFLRGLKRLH